MTPQDSDQQVPHLRIVLDEEDGLGTVPDPPQLLRRARLALAADPRDVDLERRAMAGLAVDKHRAAALLDDAEHRRQPEAGALADALGREERLEDPCARRL